jgi:hypothetical protein
MKIDRHSRTTLHLLVKHHHKTTRESRIPAFLLALAVTFTITFPELRSASGQDVPQPVSKNSLEISSPQADAVLLKTLELIVHGPAFDAKVRETVWTTGRQVVGVGTYEQAGGGSGAYNLQITMHDGDGKHRLQQISDGKLAWTRSEIAGQVSLRRVDVGRLEEWVGGARPGGIAPRLTVGAWAEMLHTIRRDYVLQVHEGHLKEERVWIVSGKLCSERRQQVLLDTGRETWPMLHPTRVLIALQSNKDETGFGQLLPIRIEYWSDPISQDTQSSSTERREGRLIALIELYSIQQIPPPSLSRFRFDNLEAEVDFVDETDRYVKMSGVELTERQMQLLRR